MKISPILAAALGVALAGLGFTCAAIAGKDPTAAAGSATKITHVDAAAAARMVAAKEVAVLDVRAAWEFAAGHIAGATNIDFHGAEFEHRLDALDKTRPWLVHCSVGGRSTRALPTLEKLGFKSIYHLDGGFNAWQAAGKPVTK